MNNSILKKPNPVSLALGTFDGLHTGHRRVIENAVNCPGALHPVILLFNEHPLLALTGKAPKRLVTKTQEEQLLRECRITPVYIDFESIMNLTSEDFVTRIARELGVRQISCGFNYRFGKNAEGTTELLKQLCDDNGIRLKVAPAVTFDGYPVSSSRIRTAIEQGDMHSAFMMLGRHFSYDFSVVESKQLGRKLGFPTINQHFPEDFVIPKYGVYASYTLVNGKLYPSVTNIGIRPTIGDGVKGSETHIIGLNEDLYGKNIKVALIKWLRSEIAFPSLDELKAQINEDKSAAINIWESSDEQID